MHTSRRLLVAAVAVVGLVGSVVAAPAAHAGVPIPDGGDVTVTKIVVGEGPAGPYDIVVECTGTEADYSVSAGESQTETLGNNNLDGGSCNVYELDSMGATSVDLVVYASDGSEMTVTPVGSPEFADATFQFDTYEESGFDYYVTVVNSFSQTGDIEALCNYMRDAPIDFGNVAEDIVDFESVDPGLVAMAWPPLEFLLQRGLELAPEAILPSWTSATVAVVTAGDILEPVGYDVSLLSEEDYDGLIEILESAQPDFLAIDQYLAANCPISDIPDPSTTTTSDVDPIVVAPRFAG